MLLFRRVLPLAVLAVLLGAAVPAHGQESLRDAAKRLRAAVAAEEAQIADTREGLADAESRLAVLDARARKRQQQLFDTQDKLVETRVRLTRLERKQATAEKLLAENLRSSYMSGEPSFVTVVMNSDGFSDLIERFEFLRRIARRNASVLGDTRDARIKVKGMTVDLKELRTTYSVLARDAAADRDRADAIRTALLNREQEQLRKRDGTAARLVSVRGQDRGDRAPPGRRRPRRARASFTAVNAAPPAQQRWRRRRRGRRRARRRRRERDRHHALRLGRRPRRRLRRLRLLGLDQLRARRGRPARQPARLGRLHELGRRPAPAAGSRSTPTPATPTWSSTGAATTPARSRAAAPAGRARCAAARASSPATRRASEPKGDSPLYFARPEPPLRRRREPKGDSPFMLRGVGDSLDVGPGCRGHPGGLRAGGAAPSRHARRAR